MIQTSKAHTEPVNVRNKIIILYAIFLLGVLVIYRTNALISLVYFLVLFAYLFVKRDFYLMYGVTLLLLDSPGGVFVESTIKYVYRLPYISLGSGATVGTLDMLMLTLLLSTLSLRVEKHTFKKEIRLYSIFGIFVLLYSLVLGIAPSYMIMLARFILAYVALYRFFATQSYDEEKMRVITYITIAIFMLAFVNHIGELYLRTSILSFLGGSRGVAAFRESMYGREELGGQRIVASPYINFFCVMLIIRRILSKNIQVKEVIVLAFCYLSIFLSATRGWIIAYSVMYLSTLILVFFNRKITNVTKLVGTLALSVGLVIVINGLTANAIFKQLAQAYQRLDTVGMILEGDLEAGGTVGRLTYTSSKSMDSWRENPILGWGFSTLSKPDGHVGNQNMLQTYGLLGFLLIYALVISFLLKNFRASQVYQRREMLAYVIAMIGILIIHSSSRQLLGYDPRGTQHIVYALFIILIVFSGSSIKNARAISAEQNHA